MSNSKGEKISVSQRVLLAQWWAYVAFSALYVFLSEADILICGSLAASETLNFSVLTSMELITVCSIPLALKMFSLKKIKKILSMGTFLPCLTLGTLRIALLGMPLLANVIFYYEFMSVAFGYMSIIDFICMFFVYPTKDGCNEDFKK